MTFLGKLFTVLKWFVTSLVKDVHHLHKHRLWECRDIYDQPYCTLCNVPFVSEMPDEMKKELDIL